VTSRLAQTAREVPTLVVTAGELAPARIEELQGLGCEIFAGPVEEGRPALGAVLDELGRRRMTNVLVEGGAEVHGSFRDADAIDEVHVFIAPRLAGGAGAKAPVGGRGVERIADALPLAGWHVETVEGDVLLHGWRA
jgi:diaminohydroxyphosphoribosylaminopyrimidine deaminase/5-amino-6-(5-phosphoribosylamino)uracil reductase